MRRWDFGEAAETSSIAGFVAGFASGADRRAESVAIHAGFPKIFAALRQYGVGGRGERGAFGYFETACGASGGCQSIAGSRPAGADLSCVTRRRWHWFDHRFHDGDGPATDRIFHANWPATASANPHLARGKSHPDALLVGRSPRWPPERRSCLQSAHANSGWAQGVGCLHLADAGV